MKAIGIELESDEAVAVVDRYIQQPIDRQSGEWLHASGNIYGVSTTSNQFNIAPVTALFFGQATDPAGDASGGGTNPDLVSGSGTTFNDGSVKLWMRFAPGTFNASTTEAEFLLDTDQNVSTGSPG